MGNRGKPITEIEIKHTLLMAKYDLPARNIANILKRSPAAVYKILKACGVAARPDERTEDQYLAADRILHIGTYYAKHGEVVEPVITPEPVEPQPEPEPVAIGTPLELVEIECKECGEEFQMTTDHIEWFENRRISVPKRCEECRERRRGMHDGGGLIGGANADQLASLRQKLERMERRLR